MRHVCWRLLCTAFALSVASAAADQVATATSTSVDVTTTTAATGAATNGTTVPNGLVRAKQWLRVQLQDVARRQRTLFVLR